MLDLSFPKSVNPCYTYDTEETWVATKHQLGGAIVLLQTAVQPLFSPFPSKVFWWYRSIPVTGTDGSSLQVLT